MLDLRHQTGIRSPPYDEAVQRFLRAVLDFMPLGFDSLLERPSTELEAGTREVTLRLSRARRV